MTTTTTTPTRRRLFHLSLSLLLLTFLSLSTPSYAKLHPAKREYETHTYYVLQLDPSSPYGRQPELLASVLGAEHVEQVGELKDHYLIRASHEVVKRGEGSWIEPKRKKRKVNGVAAAEVGGNLERDAVMERYKMVRRHAKRSSPSLHLSTLSKRSPLDPHHLSRSILSLSRQHTSLRIKRDLPVLPPKSSSTFALLRRQTTALVGAVPGASNLVQDMARRFSIADPLWPKQWHLVNGVIEENSINVTGVWDEGIFGQGVNVAIVDDGLDMHSDDLAPNFHADGSWDYNDNTALPEPRLSDDQHGTRCAGEIAAAKNEVCGVGVAHQAGISGIRILSASISDADEASSLNYGYQTNSIYSCSWGPPDDGRSMEAPGDLIKKAMLNGVQNGRGGKGSIFVFASGNGGAVDDQCNFDGYTNSLLSITVGAIDRKGLHPFYSEACAANMVVTYSSGSGDNIHTTDVGKAVCTDRHGGTSAAAPIAAGVFALVLEVRPELTWRDMQHLCVETAVQINPQDPDWQMTASGRNYNHKYGFGKLDAWAIVNAAKTWQLVKPQTWWISPIVNSGAKLTHDGVTAGIEVTADDLKESNFELLEHVTITVKVEHQRRGNIEVELDSPRGMKSILARPRRFDEASSGMEDWIFMTVKHWDEDPVGTWTLRVRDRQTNNKNGTFVHWKMQLWGSTVDASKAVPWTFPTPVQDDEEDGEDEAPTSTIDEATLTDSATIPTRTLVRPTAHLPDDHASQEGEAHSAFGEPPTPTQTPASDDPLEDEKEEEEIIHVPTSTAESAGESDGGYESEEDYDDSTPGYVAGMQRLLKSSTWLFVAGGTIVIFLAATTAFFWMRKRPGRLSRGGAYDFAPQTDDDFDMPMSAMERGRLRLGEGEPGSARTRALFDAFALASDSEDEMSDDEGRSDQKKQPSEKQQGPYKDDLNAESFVEDDEEANPIPLEERNLVDEEKRARAEFSD